MSGKLSFRYADSKDVPLILSFIKELAIYEKMLDQVVATEESLQESLFQKKQAEVIFAMVDNQEVGFALFFHNFSTFVGKSGLYLEDLFIKEAYRGKGYGKAFMRHLAQIAIERDCGRFEWCCLDWNQSSINFYLSIGAKAMDEWTTYRASGKALQSLAE